MVPFSKVPISGKTALYKEGGYQKSTIEYWKVARKKRNSLSTVPLENPLNLGFSYLPK